MTRSVSVRELKSKTSEILGWVQSGEEVTVTRRGKPIVRLVPEARKPSREEVEAWLRRVDETRIEISKHWPKGVSAVDAIREDRDRLERR
jgi:prevent-host-death family protein